ncbi:MAG: hypothetical protein RID42_03440 [Alphaproteobacteria bacterium]
MRQRGPNPNKMEPGTTWVRAVSALIALGVVALIARDPAWAGSNGTLLQRAGGAAMIVGAVGALLYALELRGTRPPVRALTHPSAAWTLVLVGAAGQALV